jgi:hypothetical protein
MTEIRNVCVYGLEQSIKRSALPMMSSFSDDNNLTENDIVRAHKLAKNMPGTGHNNFLKGIIVQFDIKYPEYLSPEMQRYHWFEIVSSMSKMHRLTKMDIGSSVNKYVDPTIIEILRQYVNNYNQDPCYENFMKVLSNCPLGLEKWMSITTNYLQLKTIYFQRKNHKLKEDWGAIINMIENLPYSKLITEYN